MALPPRLPERGPLRGLFRWLNALRDEVESKTLRPTPDTMVTRTGRGQTVTPIVKPSVTRTSGGEATWL